MVATESTEEARLRRDIMDLDRRIEAAFWDEEDEESIDENNRRIKARDHMQTKLDQITGKIPPIKVG